MADTATSVSESAAGQDPTRSATAGMGFRPLVAVAAVIVALVGGFGLGSLGGGTAPSPGPAPAAVPSDLTASGHSHAPGTAPHQHSTGTSSGTDVTGLTITSAGYRLVPASTTLSAGKPQTLSFRIVGPDQAPVTSYAVNHDKPMHLVVVRRDLSGYRHLHPTMAPDGTWSVPLAPLEAGAWRAFADFVVSGTGGAKTYATLGVDLTASGVLRSRPLPPPARTSTVAGYDVGYAGTPKVGSAQPLLFSVSRNDSPATLERYLGAYGHLVVLREGDLGYVHAHAESQLAGGAAKFWLATPSPGRYRMFFDFQTGGKVQTAGFTIAIN